MYVNDSSLTGRPKVGKATLPLSSMPRDGKVTMSLPLEAVNPGQKAQGEVLLDVSFKVFEDDEQVRGCRGVTRRVVLSHRVLRRRLCAKWGGGGGCPPAVAPHTQQPRSARLAAHSSRQGIC